MHAARTKEATSSFGDSHRPGYGWCGVKNGKLPALADLQFDVFITTDKNLRYQQNLARLKLAIVLLPTNRVLVVIALIPKIEEVLKTIQPGEFIEIAMP